MSSPISWSLFRKATEVREDYQARLLGALAVAGLGDDESARSAYEKALEVIAHQLELNPDDTRALSLGAGCLARLGEREESIQWAGRAVAIDPKDAVILYAVACVYAIIGLPDEAIAYLDGAVNAGFGNFGWIENDPDMDSIRDDPRYLAILKRT